jgi:hypothetical protein
MRRMIAAVAMIIGMAMTGVAMAQSATSTDPAPQTQSPRIAPGSVIPVELTKTIDAKKAKTGDEVMAKVTQDMKDIGGAVIVAKDTKMVGHVTQAQARTKEQKESEVGITFDKAVSKSGEMKLPMSIQAIVAPVNSAPGDASGYGQNAPATGSGTATSPMGGHNAPMEGSGRPPSPSAVPNGGSDASSGGTRGGTRPPLTASTQGVIGMPDVKLLAAQDAAQGSVVSSEKNNVKLESGTILLLRVVQ